MNKFYIFFMCLGLTFFSLITPARSMEAGDRSPDDGSSIVKANIFGAYNAKTVTDRVTKWVAQQALRQKIQLSPLHIIQDNYYKKLAALTTNIKKKSAPFFASNSKHHPNAVVFNVDDTTLLSEETLTTLYPIISRLISRPIGDKLLAVPHMLNLCNFFVKNGFIIIFITARSEKLFECTIGNLLSTGYTVNRLFCMPYQATMKVQEYRLASEDQKASDTIVCWKTLEICDLLCFYNIVAFVDDSEDNIAEAETLLPGRCFKVPTLDEV